MSTWTHKGVTITLDEPFAVFRFEVGGKRHKARSLDAAKKRINGLRENSFEPFDALQLYFIDISVEPVRVTGLQPRTSRLSRSSYEFVAVRTIAKLGREIYAQTFNTLYPDTPECRAAYQAYMEMKAKNDAARKQMNKDEFAARAAIPEIHANDYHDKGELVIHVPADEGR